MAASDSAAVQAAVARPAVGPNRATIEAKSRGADAVAASPAAAILLRISPYPSRPNRASGRIPLAIVVKPLDAP
jgi:hypothetical protein